MPKILERLVGQLEGKGMPKPNAFAVATSTLQKAGDLKKGTGEATAKGAKRGDMTPGARAKDRSAKTSGRSTKDYKYDKQTNRATLK